MSGERMSCCDQRFILKKLAAEAARELARLRKLVTDLDLIAVSHKNRLDDLVKRLNEESAA